MLDPEKRATECDPNRSLIFLQSDEDKAEPIIVDDLLDNRSNFAQIGLYSVLAQLRDEQMYSCVSLLDF